MNFCSICAYAYRRAKAINKKSRELHELNRKMENEEDATIEETKILDRLEKDFSGNIDEMITDEIKQDQELKDTEAKVIRLVSYEAYCESIPQAILQAYTLWKRPLACFKLDDFNNGKSLLSL